jgi:hypothetical protein
MPGDRRRDPRPVGVWRTEHDRRDRSAPNHPKARTVRLGTRPSNARRRGSCPNHLANFGRPIGQRVSDCPSVRWGNRHWSVVLGSRSTDDSQRARCRASSPGSGRLHGRRASYRRQPNNRHHRPAGAGRQEERRRIGVLRCATFEVETVRLPGRGVPRLLPSVVEVFIGAANKSTERFWLSHFGQADGDR